MFLGPNATRADDYNVQVEANNCQVNAPGTQDPTCASLQSERDSIETMDLISVISGVFGVAALGTSVYLMTQGPQTGIYDQYKEDVGVTGSIRALPGGGMASALLRF